MRKIIFIFLLLPIISFGQSFQKRCPTGSVSASKLEDQVTSQQTNSLSGGGQTVRVGRSCATGTIPVLASSYVSNSDPTKVVLKYNQALSNSSVPATSAYALAGKTISGVAIADSSVTLTVTVEYEYADVISLNYTTPAVNPVKALTGGKLAASLTSESITNNVISGYFTLTSTGTGAGVSTLAITVSSNITATLDGAAKFYTDAGGTLGESSTWGVTSGAMRTIYLKCPSSTAKLKFTDISKITTIGNSGTGGWISGANAPSANINLLKIPNATVLRFAGTSMVSNPIPSGVTYLNLGSGVAWTYSGALPTGLTSLTLVSANIAWTYSGALPTNLTAIGLNGANIAWTYSGALPTGLTSLSLTGNNIAWTYSGALPTGLTLLILNGTLIDWTGLDISGTGNITSFSLTDYRSSKMNSTDMITLLTNLTNRVGGLPATVTINDYADYASPPAGVTDAVNTLKTTKSVTTVTLGS